tara:strand:- start:3579 stop:4931 length:1353 start_codon:yes stop_codon:yes gene_type:complete
MGIILGLLHLIIEGQYKVYFTNLKNNRFFVAALIFYALHLIGLFWSDDFSYGLNDLKSKATLFVVPLIIITKPLVLRKSYKLLIGLFVLTLLTTSVINYIVFHFYGNEFNFTDARDMSLFNSHIRYAIMVVFAIPLLYDLSLDNKRLRTIFVLVALWFLFYTISSQVLTGLISFAAMILAIIIYPLLIQRKYISLTFFLLSGIFSCSLIYIGLKSNMTSEGMPSVNVEGIKEAWEQKSELSYDGKDLRNQDLKYTLARFLLSKKYPNNSSGVARLNNQEIMAIEKGMAHFSEMKGGFLGRIEGLRYQLSHMSDPNGHSLLQRFEAWKVGFSIFKKSPIIGVGTGDLKNAFAQEYIALDTRLSKKNQIRAHNTFLTSAITFGVFGLLLFLYLIFISGRIQIQNQNLSGFIFWTIILVTFFFEDTLETQTGITMFAFFIALFSLPIPRPSMD